MFPAAAYGQTYIPLEAPAAILVEQTTGRILYGVNIHNAMYPASMSKMLTALVVLDYLHPDQILTIGSEIRGMPLGYATNIHVEGETITVRMLLRALLIRSGNETGRILALNVIRTREGNPNIPYNDAKRLFSVLMNERARSLGAINTHFNNPYGLHSEAHFTTAYDMALIARAFMEVPLLTEIVATRVFTGDSLEGGADYFEGALVRQYNWTNHNQMLPGGTHGYAHVTGIKTGFTTPAGHCLAASATRNNLSLIAVVFNSPDPWRWQDTRHLLDYGFDNYAFRTIQQQDEQIDEVQIFNPRLGDYQTLAVLANDTHTSLLSHWEYDNLTRIITYNPLLIVSEERYAYDDGTVRLQAPIIAGEVIGTVSYLYNETIKFQGNIIAARDVLERTFDSDMDYYIARFISTIFTTRALPYWFGATGMLVGVLGVGFAVSTRRKVNNDRWGYGKSKY